MFRVDANLPGSRKTALTLITFVALALAPYAVPALSRYRVLMPQALLALMNSGAGETGVNDRDYGGFESASSLEMTPGKIEDPSGHALDGFFASLLKTETESSQTVISHYGDSPITNDGITSTVRRKLQLRFGDAGHGFVLVDRPWAWYEHTGVLREASRGWKSEPICISRGELLYGLGGVSFTASAAGTNASFSTVAEGDVGRSVSAFEIYFMIRPGGGDFDIEVDEQHVARVRTDGEQNRSGFHRLVVPEGPHRLKLKIVGNREVQMFGVTLASSSAGVQYDSLGVNGAFVSLLARYLDPDHWAEQLRHRRPDLVIIGYGTNESQFERLPMDQYEQDSREAVRRIRAALPDVSIMLMGPIDRGMRGAGGAIVTRPMIPKLTGYQRRLAAETGCAFFDTFTAMGGSGTAARWHDSRPRLMGGDFTHPTVPGAEIVGTLFYEAITEAFEEFKTNPKNRELPASAGRQHP